MLVLMLPKQGAPVQSASSVDTKAASELLQLPDAALRFVLQHLDQCSLTCAAVTCSKLRHTAPATISKLEVQCRTSKGLNSVFKLLEQHSTSLTRLSLCNPWSCCDGDTWDHGLRLHKLAGPQLRQLSLDDIEWQLEPAGSCPGVLHGCTGLTALNASVSVVVSIPAATAAIAALTDLRSLQLLLGSQLLLDMQRSSQLTYLSIRWRSGLSPQNAAQLSKLSGLVNLQHLKLSQLPYTGIPGGVPSQLTKLTRLHLAYRESDDERADFASQLKALSTFTALRELCVFSDDYRPAEALFGIEHLSLLTSLEVRIPGMKFSSEHSWVRSLTALQLLSYASRSARCTQSRSLVIPSCGRYRLRHPVTEMTLRLTAVLNAVSQLVQLTELRVTTGHLEMYIQDSSRSCVHSTHSQHQPVLPAAQLLQAECTCKLGPVQTRQFVPTPPHGEADIRQQNRVMWGAFQRAAASAAVQVLPSSARLTVCSACRALTHSPATPAAAVSAYFFRGAQRGCSRGSCCSTVERAQEFGAAGPSNGATA
jgi:hypothetical protein